MPDDNQDNTFQTTAWPASEKNQAYHERNQLVALLARIYPNGYLFRFYRPGDLPSGTPFEVVEVNCD